MAWCLVGFCCRDVRLRDAARTSCISRKTAGVTAASAANYLSPSLDHLYSPYLMRGMTAAVERLSAAIANKEGILIYGDYDVDGTTAVVILKTALELCGGAADFHVPHRIKEGYGIKDDRTSDQFIFGAKTYSRIRI